MMSTVIYVYCKVALPAVENPEEVEISACANVLSMQQQQVCNDEIYEDLNTTCNEIGCPLKFYEDTIRPFEYTSGPDVAAQRKVPSS